MIFFLLVTIISSQSHHYHHNDEDNYVNDYDDEKAYANRFKQLFLKLQISQLFVFLSLIEHPLNASVIFASSLIDEGNKCYIGSNIREVEEVTNASSGNKLEIK